MIMEDSKFHFVDIDEDGSYMFLLYVDDTDLFYNDII